MARPLVLVVSTPRRLVAGWFSSRGKFIERVRVSRPDRRSVRVNFSRVELDRRGAYEWQALAYFRGASCPRGCLDRAPNGSHQMLHDLIAPSVSFPQPPPPAGVTYNLDFSVSDRGGSQLDFWRLEQRDPGTQDWNVVDQQAATGAQSVEFTAGLPGDTDEFRVVAPRPAWQQQGDPGPRGHGPALTRRHRSAVRSVLAHACPGSSPD